MRWGAAWRWKKPARTQCHEVVVPMWYRQRGLGQNGGAQARPRWLMPPDHCTSRAICNLRSTTQYVKSIVKYVVGCGDVSVRKSFERHTQFQRSSGYTPPPR